MPVADLDVTRICPGRYFVDTTLWLMMSNILAVFDIEPPFDASKIPQKVGDIKYTSGLTRLVLLYDPLIVVLIKRP